jgi:hypothetical protein
MIENTIVFHEKIKIVQADEKQPVDMGEPC